MSRVLDGTEFLLLGFNERVSRQQCGHWSAALLPLLPTFSLFIHLFIFSNASLVRFDSIQSALFVCFFVCLFGLNGRFWGFALASAVAFLVIWATELIYLIDESISKRCHRYVEFSFVYRVLPSFAEFYLVLPGITKFYRVLLGFTGFYWVLAGYYQVLLSFSWLLLGFTGFNGS